MGSDGRARTRDGTEHGSIDESDGVDGCLRESRSGLEEVIKPSVEVGELDCLGSEDLGKNLLSGLRQEEVSTQLRRKEDAEGRREGELTARTMPPIPSPGIMAMRSTVGLTNCMVELLRGEEGERG